VARDHEGQEDRSENESGAGQRWPGPLRTFLQPSTHAQQLQEGPRSTYSSAVVTSAPLQETPRTTPLAATSRRRASRADHRRVRPFADREVWPSTRGGRPGGPEGSVPLIPGAEPFAQRRRPRRSAVLHGSRLAFFPSRCGRGEALAGAWAEVRLPRLPGHGSTWQDSSVTRWTTGWPRPRVVAELRETCSDVSSWDCDGWTLALRLAAPRHELRAGPRQPFGPQRQQAALCPAA